MNNPYAKLGGGALDQELFKKKVDKEDIPVSSNNLASVSRNPENQNSGNTENKPKREFFTKATYRMSDEALDAIDAIKRTLKRQYKIKVNLEEIAEEAIIATFKDLQENKQGSNLVKKFSRNPENQ